MTDFTCPICGTVFNDDQYRLAERLSSWGYLHLDIWVKCPKCKYTPTFGRELQDTKPVYWRPKTLPHAFKRQVEQAFHRLVPEQPCPFGCPEPMELHKIWIHTWKQFVEAPTGDGGDVVYSDAPKDVREAFQFIVCAEDKSTIDKYFIPAGIMAQYKCRNQPCKYVRYITL